MEKLFERDFRALGEIFAFADRFAERHGFDQFLKNSVNLIVEELFTNMVKYNTGGGHPIRVRMKVENGSLRIELVDEDVDAWDPTQVPNVRVDRLIEARKPGGLGLHLVRSIADELKYDYKNRRMTVTVIKSLERGHVRGTADR